jgi:hypothetical protein
MNFPETQYKPAATAATMQQVMDSKAIASSKPSPKPTFQQDEMVYTLTRLRQLLSVLRDTI